MKISCTAVAISICLLISGMLYAQNENSNNNVPKMQDRKDNTTLTSEQLVIVKSILLKYNPLTLTSDEAKAIHKSFRDAGLKAGFGLNEAVNAAGFNSDKLRDLDPPPNRKNIQEEVSGNIEKGRKDIGENSKPNKQ